MLFFWLIDFCGDSEGFENILVEFFEDIKVEIRIFNFFGDSI